MTPLRGALTVAILWRSAAAIMHRPSMAASATQEVEEEVNFVVDDAPGLGLVWEGVGAISGGGATSKLLYDYPEDVASKILDVLFKPGHGLNLQILKVEIGGDTDATEGAEPSHIHFDGDEDYNRGYEWWLMREAKKRNPDIKLYGLPWGFPGHLDSTATPNVMATNVFERINRTVDYTLKWVLGAKRVHGLDIDYVGLWNEKDAPDEYRDALRMAAGSSEVGQRTKVLNRLVHYPGSTNTPDENGCKQHADDTEPGANWVDEEGSMFDGRSARCLARVLNRNYISMCKTATFQWHLISSFYDYLPWPRCGVAVADQPWSGAFEITSPLWAIAHTTQFAPIGWRYAAHGAGVHMLQRGGSMVARISPDMRNFSIVIEKIRPETSACGHGVNPPLDTDEETVLINLQGKFLEAAKAARVLRVWASDLTSSSDYGANPPDENLFQMSEIDVPEDGIIRLQVQPEQVYTLTTLKTGGRVVPESPPRAEFPIPYSQTFDDERIGSPARLWYDQMGAWEIQRTPYFDHKKHGNVMRQVVPVFPNCWGYACEPPITFFGPSSFGGDLTISMDVYFEGHGQIAITPMGLNYSSILLRTVGDWAFGNLPDSQIDGEVNFTQDRWNSFQMRMKPNGEQIVIVNGVTLPTQSLHASEASFLTTGSSVSEEQCGEATFPISTRGRQYMRLKPDRADNIDACRLACCRDENLCNIWQWNGEKCQIGRKEEGWVKDLEGKFIGGIRGDKNGWHLKVRLGRYAPMSIDNFQIYESGTKPPLESTSKRESESNAIGA